LVITFMAFERNLILVAESRHMDRADFEAIAARIHATTDTIEVFVAENGSLNMRLARKAAERPTLVVCPAPLDMFRPRRGRIFQGQWIGKVEEFKRLRDAGLPVPAWRTITPGTDMSAEEWGQAVVVKPSFGGQNRDITLMAPSQVAFIHPKNLADDHRGKLGAMIAQTLVDTGPLLPEYRVLCLMGEPLYAIELKSRTPAPGWPPTLSEPINLSALLKDRSIAFINDPDVLDLARRVHAAMPDVATTGCDIIREARSGKLFVMEANCKGLSWHLSSALGRKQQADSGLNFSAQFGAIEVAARVLAEQTRQLAV
jgi:hypothetical protein